MFWLFSRVITRLEPITAQSGLSFQLSAFFFLFSCQIDWKKGKNVTLKTIKKKQKHKGRGTVRTVTKTVTNDSFFNFFSPPEGKLNIS